MARRRRPRRERRESALLASGRSAQTLPAMDLLPHFMDLSYAYRFGPTELRRHRRDACGTGMERNWPRRFTFPAASAQADRRRTSACAPVASMRDDGTAELVVSSRRLAQCVHIDIPGYEPEDDYFHLLPGFGSSASPPGRPGPVAHRRGARIELHAQRAHRSRDHGHRTSQLGRPHERWHRSPRPALAGHPRRTAGAAAPSFSRPPGAGASAGSTRPGPARAAWASCCAGRSATRPSAPTAPTPRWPKRWRTTVSTCFASTITAPATPPAATPIRTAWRPGSTASPRRSAS